MFIDDNMIGSNVLSEHLRIWLGAVRLARRSSGRLCTLTSDAMRILGEVRHQVRYRGSLGFEVSDLTAGFNPDLSTGISPIPFVTSLQSLTGSGPVVSGGHISFNRLFDGRWGDAHRKRWCRTGNSADRRIGKVGDHVVNLKHMFDAIGRDEVRFAARGPVEGVPLLHTPLAHRQNRRGTQAIEAKRAV
jgi:hypothetical protein